MLQDEFLQLRRIALARERIGVVPVGQQHDADVQSLAQQHVDPAHRRLDAGAVAVVDHRHVPREAADQPDLPFGQRRARGRDDVLDARLVHLDHVGISLDQNAAVLLHDGPFGVIKSVEDVALVVDLRLGRVEVFGDFLVGAHRPAAEGGHAAADAVDREHHAAAEAVVIAARLALDRQAGADEELLFVAVGERLPSERVARGRAVAESELADRRVRESALAEIGDPDAAALRRVVQRADEVVGRVARYDHHALAVVVPALLFGRLFALGHLDAVFLRDVLQRLEPGHVFVLHHERDGVAALAAAETLEKSFRRRHDERGGLLVVERAASQIVDPIFLQRDEVADHLDDVGCRIDAVYGRFVDHFCSGNKRYQRYDFFRPLNASGLRRPSAGCRASLYPVQDQSEKNGGFPDRPAFGGIFAGGLITEVAEAAVKAAATRSRRDARAGCGFLSRSESGRRTPRPLRRAGTKPCVRCRFPPPR